MKKLLPLIAVVLFSCTQEEYYEPVNFTITPTELEIIDPVGIKLESKFATESVLMNVKLEVETNYYIKIVDNTNRVVSKEKVTGNIGDNIFKVYTSTLPKSSYRIELFQQDKKVGATTINLL